MWFLIIIGLFYAFFELGAYVERERIRKEMEAHPGRGRLVRVTIPHSCPECPDPANCKGHKVKV